MSLHVISDALIALAYFSIPFSILRFVHGRSDLDRRQVRLAFLFTAFIALCGLTHVVSIVVLWVPIYIIEGWIKAATAVVSVVTAGWLAALVPYALTLPSVMAMQREVNARRDSEAELRVAQDDLHQSVALLRTVIEVVPGLIYAKDRSGRLLLANKATLDLINKPWDEVEGKRDIEFLADPRQAEIVMANDRKVLATGALLETEEIVNHPVKGTRVYISTKVPLRESDHGVIGIVGSSIDITERRDRNKEALHTARRTAMGDMAAAIAHEINQPLTAIAMYIAGSITLLEKDHYEGPLIQSLTIAKEQCLRAGEIIRRVRSFVSGGGDEKRPEDLPHIVDDACGLALLGSRDSGVAISIEHADANIPVSVDKVQIIQVIVNLVRNAMDAMVSARGMALRVRTGYGPGDVAMVSVSDTGPGISAEVFGRLFEPFVSTKGIKGMGVGLSICRTIIESHGGKIWADPSAEAGATFYFTLPHPNGAVMA